MARLRGHHVLDVERPLFVKRGLMIGARAFAVGDLFTWRDLGLPFRKLHQLWTQRRVGHERPGERRGAENPGALVQKPSGPRLPTPIASFTIETEPHLSDAELDALTAPQAKPGGVRAAIDHAIETAPTSTRVTQERVDAFPSKRNSYRRGR